MEGLRASLDRQVTDADTAAALGSGDVPVLGTPRLLAWLEAACVAALGDRLGPERTSVGVAVELRHQAATTVGGSVVVTAELVAIGGRTMEFAVTAHDAAGRAVASGSVRRVVVDRNRFLRDADRAAPLPHTESAATDTTM